MKQKLKGPEEIEHLTWLSEKKIVKFFIAPPKDELSRREEYIEDTNKIAHTN